MPAPQQPPPPPKPSNKRKHARFELLASVELHQGDETLILPARNLSMGGIYLGSDGNSLERFTIGTAMEVLVFDGVDESHPAFSANAEVVRHDDEGMALRWDPQPETSKAVKLLLKALKPVPEPDA